MHSLTHSSVVARQQCQFREIALITLEV
jgi:hypothetical protein